MRLKRLITAGALLVVSVSMTSCGGGPIDQGIGIMDQIAGTIDTAAAFMDEAESKGLGAEAARDALDQVGLTQKLELQAQALKKLGEEHEDVMDDDDFYQHEDVKDIRKRMEKAMSKHAELKAWVTDIMQRADR